MKSKLYFMQFCETYEHLCIQVTVLEPQWDSYQIATLYVLVTVFRVCFLRVMVRVLSVIE